MKSESMFKQPGTELLESLRESHPCVTEPNSSFQSPGFARNKWDLPIPVDAPIDNARLYYNLPDSREKSLLHCVHLQGPDYYHTFWLEGDDGDRRFGEYSYQEPGISDVVKSERDKELVGIIKKISVAVSNLLRPDNEKPKDLCDDFKPESLPPSPESIQKFLRLINSLPPPSKPRRKPLRLVKSTPPKPRQESFPSKLESLHSSGFRVKLVFRKYCVSEPLSFDFTTNDGYTAIRYSYPDDRCRHVGEYSAKTGERRVVKESGNPSLLKEYEFSQADINIFIAYLEGRLNLDDFLL